MSDGINDAEGKEPFSLYKNRAKHKGRWGVWDCGYFYPDAPKNKKKKRKVSKVIKKKRPTNERLLRLLTRIATALEATVPQPRPDTGVR